MWPDEERGFGFIGNWALCGIHFLNILLSYYDDIKLMRVVDMLYSVHKGTASVYKLFPTYATSLVIKTLANIGMIIVAINYYDGWRAHTRNVYKKYLETELEEINDYGKSLDTETEELIGSVNLVAI